MEKIKGTIERIVYYNPENGYTVMQVKDHDSSYTCVGNFHELQTGTTIVADGEWVSSKYGRQFSVRQWHEELPATIKGIEAYLASGLIKGIGPKYAKRIVDTFGTDTFSVLDYAPERLMTVDGIGKGRMEKIRKSWEENKAVSNIMIFLQGHGISPAFAVKIYKEYGDKSIEKVRENPYALADDIIGIGFKKADEIAFSFGCEKTDLCRLKAGVIYTLGQMSNDGHCYMERDRLTAAAMELLDVEGIFIGEALNHLVFEQKVIEEEDKFFLPMYYYSEVGVARRIRNLVDHPDKEYKELDIEKISKETGIEYDDKQKEAISEAVKSKFMVLTGGPGCVDCNTEYFNGNEWRKISDYRSGDKVLQYNSDGTAEMVYPLRYIKEPCDHMLYFKTKYGVDQCVSDDHRIVYKSQKGKMHVKTAAEVKVENDSKNGGFKGLFLTSFNYGGEGIDLSDAEIRLMCAVVCDGNFYSKHDYNRICCINIKKQRKKERLEMLLKEMNAVYETKQNNPKDPEYLKYYFEAPRKEKSFGSFWYRCNKHQLEVFCDEICRWDGSEKNGRLSFSSSVKETADFVQFAFSATGHRARVSIHDRSGQQYLTNGKVYIRKSPEYNVSICDITKISIHNSYTKDNITDVVPEDGYKYCFTVPSSMLVLRREGCINITGNCGKTVTTKGIIRALESMDKRILLAAPTGRAAKRMSEATDREAKTIHRLLEYTPKDGFKFNENNPLRGDVLIVDESSMIDIVLMNSLIKAVPLKMRVILVGDIDQLPSVGAGNVLRDIIDSGIVPVVRLTRIFRQALTSRIVTNAHKVNRGEMPDTSNGKESDFFFITQTDAQIAADSILGIVKERIPNTYGYGINDIQVLTPMKNGAVGTNNLNIILQEAINPKGEFIQCGQFKYRKGDKVMQIKNDYDKNVFNGDVGYVLSIDTEERSMVVSFNGEEVPYESGDLTELTLAYACTIHKSQGSEYPVVVMPLMMSHYIMLQRNLVYTGITRAKKICIVIGDKKALAMAVRNMSVLKRNTMLKERLKA